jgi:hypothetical protein
MAQDILQIQLLQLLQLLLPIWSPSAGAYSGSTETMLKLLHTNNLVINPASGEIHNLYDGHC